MKINHFCYITILFLIAALGGCKVEVPQLQQDDPDTVSSFRNYYQNEVLPYYFEQGEFGSFAGVDGIDIAYGVFAAAESKGALVILHGLNETAIKYAEFIYDMRDTGYTIYIMEHRGHGDSGRILDGNDQARRKIYIKDFDNYVLDAKTFYDDIVTASQHENIVFFAHSVGGNVATQYIEQYPDDFAGAILSSPMLEVLTTHPIKTPEDLGYSVSKLMVALGLGKSYSLDMQEPAVIIDSTSQDKWEHELLTKSWKRWTTYNEVIEQNQHLIAGGPGATWGITNRFAKEAYEATFKARSAAEAAKITIPVLMFQSGDDWIVGNKGQNTFADNAINAPYFETIMFADAYHEAYMENDEIRDELIGETKAFLSEF